MVLQSSLTTLAIGLGVGLVAALSATRLLQSMLFEIHATDAVTFLGVPVLLGAAALLASYIPARRTTKIDPVIALRCE